MATFSIDIKRYILPYADNVKNLVKESCENSTTSYPIGVVASIPFSPTSLFLLNEYVGQTRLNLHIKNISYLVNGITTPYSSITSNVALKYNGTVLEGGGTTIIDISSVNAGDFISNLVLESKVDISEINHYVVTFDYSIENIFNDVEVFTSTKITLATVKCSLTIPPTVSNICTGSGVCAFIDPTVHYLTVTVPEGEKLYLRIHNTFKGLGTVNGVITRFETPRCTHTVDPYIVVTAFNAREVGDYRFVTYDPVSLTSYLDLVPFNVIHLAIKMCPLRLWGDEATLDNVNTIAVDILDSDGNIIHTESLTETRPGI